MNEKLENWVRRLNGFEYPADEIECLRHEMEKDGIITIYCMSDDLLECVGAINDEFSAWRGFSGRLTKDLTIFNDDEDEDEDDNTAMSQAEKEALPFIKAVWCPEDAQGKIYASWMIETDLPYGEFEIYANGELYCVGIIVAVEDIKQWKKER